jgi:hypothetical protein
MGLGVWRPPLAIRVVHRSREAGLSEGSSENPDVMTDIDPTAAEPPSLGLCLPPSWRRTSDPGCGLLVRARAPVVPAGGVPPEVVVRSEATDLDLEPWTDQVVSDLAERLDAFAVEDDDAFDLLGVPACYRR